MGKAFSTWKVQEHGQVRTLQDNLHYVDGAVPGMSLRRCMCVARMANGGLVIHNAVALDDAAMAMIDGLGEVEYILVPSAYHRLDAPNFAKRYPNAKVLCPPGARKKVEAVVQVHGTYKDFPEDADVALEVLDGVRGAEGVMRVKSGDTLSIVFNDALFNVSKESGGFVMGLIGSTGGPKVTRIMRLFVIKQKKALRAHYERLAALPGLARLVPGHGEIIEVDAAQTLRSVASTL